MYAIVKTGGKQYKVAPGDVLEVEKLDAEVGENVELEVICIVDGEKVEADPAKAAETKVEAVVIEQFKGDKVLVFKFKKRKNYKKMRGHRQKLTRIQIVSVGGEKAAPKPAKKAAVAKKDDAAKVAAPKAEKKPAAKKAAAPKKAETEKAPAAAKKSAPKKTEAPSSDAE